MAVRSPRARQIFLAFDAFGTLFAPRRPVAVQYGELARKHGISGFTDEQIQTAFRKAFKDEARRHPNYGKDVGMKAPAWWANGANALQFHAPPFDGSKLHPLLTVLDRQIITNTFDPFIRHGQSLPQGLVPDLLTRFSTNEGYTLFPDVLPFFAGLKSSRVAPGPNSGYLARSSDPLWPWNTRVGIITNSDDRIPGILGSFGLSVGARRVGRIEDQVEKATCEDHDIDFVVLSYDVGAEKPDRRMFDAAEEMFVGAFRRVEDQRTDEAQEKGYELWYVGDDREKDIGGALDAGWKAVHLLRDRSGALDVDEKDEGNIIRDLKELRTVIERSS